MTMQDYRNVILEGIENLPPDILAEIADFVLFVRKRAMQPQAFQEELEMALLSLELKQLSRQQESHLEEEFADYERRYPVE